ncbi:MAG: polyprenol monophosphomannose synthase [Patescibacteria group bacterium]|jgi:dolichol-phosphate mannosyltransferase
MLHVSIIIPTYNEADNLEPLLQEIFSSVDKNRFDVEVIIVDDNSPDGTGRIADQLSVRFPLQIIHRSSKLGLGSAVREGFAKSKRDVVGVMDADLSHDPNIVNKLLGELENGADLVIGSRFEEGSVVEKWKWWRKVISKTGVFITKFITGVNDPLSGYFFLRKKVIDGVDLTATGYKILLEILVKGNHGPVKEVPFRFRIRLHSTSKLSAVEYWLFFQQIIAYGWYKLFR